MITGVRIENQTATVMVDPTGTYLYSLDNLNWQNSNTFYGLNNGLYTVYVKTETGCIVGSYDFAIFSITNAITPNGDGINDTWIIAGLEKYRNSEIVVYDRYGLEVFKKIVNGTFVWDGMVKAGPLPSNSYWYTLKVSDGRLFTGYLLIKNRD
jgi:gliding motility-associated-like protein